MIVVTRAKPLEGCGVVAHAHRPHRFGDSRLPSVIFAKDSAATSQGPVLVYRRRPR
jgi:hypothetical protein